MRSLRHGHAGRLAVSMQRAPDRFEGCTAGMSDLIRHSLWAGCVPRRIARAGLLIRARMLMTTDGGRDVNWTVYLKEVDAAAMAWAQTPQQVVEILEYVVTAR